MKNKLTFLLVILPSCCITELFICFCRYRANIPVMPSLNSVVNLLIVAIIVCLLIHCFYGGIKTSSRKVILSIVYIFNLFVVFHSLYFPYINTELNIFYLPFPALPFIICLTYLFYQLIINNNAKSCGLLIISLSICFITVGFQLFTHYKYSSKILYYAVIVVVLLLSLLFLRRDISSLNCTVKQLVFRITARLSRVNITFSVTSLICGLLLCFFLPITCTVTWDDAEHYSHFLALSQSDFVATDGFDEICRFRPLDNATTYTARSDRAAAINASENNQYQFDYYESKNALSLTKIGYMGFLPGYYLSLILLLPKHFAFIFAKLSNLFLYIIIINIAIYKLPTGKRVLACVALLPSIIFLTCNFSYDSWTFSFCCLATAYYFSCFDSSQAHNQRLLIYFIAFTILGVLAKPAYIFLFLLILLIPNSFFPDSKFKTRSIFFVLLATIMVLLIAYIYFIVYRSGIGDHRVEGTSLSGQLMYIFMNPLQFIINTNKYIFNDYLQPTKLWALVSSMAYIGIGPLTLSYLTMFSFMIISFTDTNRDNFRITLKSRMSGLLLMYFFVFLICLGLFLIFTPVGYDTVLGCQERYLLPLVLPCLFFAFSGWHRNKGKFVDTISNTVLYLNALFLIYTVSILVVIPQV